MSIFITKLFGRLHGDGQQSIKVMDKVPGTR